MDLQDLLQKAAQMQEQMQKNMDDARKELVTLEVVGESGAGLVKVTMNGRYDVKRVQLDDEVMREDKTVIEDLLAAAVNDAVRKAAKTGEMAMSGAVSELIPPGIFPPGFKFPV